MELKVGTRDGRACSSEGNPFNGIESEEQGFKPAVVVVDKNPFNGIESLRAGA